MRKSSLLPSPLLWLLSSQRSLMSLLMKQELLNKIQSMRILPLMKVTATRRSRTPVTQWVCPWTRIPSQMKIACPKAAWS